MYQHTDFLPVEGFKGLYSVNRLGVVRNERNGKTVPWNDNGHGYQKVHLRKWGVSFPLYVHRIVAETFLYNSDPQRTEVNHINCRRDDNRSINLEWVTPQENIAYILISKFFDFSPPPPVSYSSDPSDWFSFA